MITDMDSSVALVGEDSFSLLEQSLIWLPRIRAEGSMNDSEDFCTGNLDCYLGSDGGGMIVG